MEGEGLAAGYLATRFGREMLEFSLHLLVRVDARKTM